ncbi:MAG: hypothetical protein QM661_09700 [Solimonas sp.]
MTNAERDTYMAAGVRYERLMDALSCAPADNPEIQRRAAETEALLALETLIGACVRPGLAVVMLAALDRYRKVVDARRVADGTYPWVW